MYRINSLKQLEPTGSGTGVFLPRVSVSRPVKWAAAGSDSAFKNPDAASQPSRLDQGSQPRQETTESAANALVSEVLPNLTPVSSPTAGAVGHIEHQVALLHKHRCHAAEQGCTVRGSQ